MNSSRTILAAGRPSRSMTSVLVTLSRAQKIADRLREGGLERLNRAQSALGVVSVSASQARVTAQGMVEATVRARTDLAEGQRWLDVYAKVRIAIGKANAKTGVSDLLAQIDAHNRVVGVYKSISASTGQQHAHAAASVASGSIAFTSSNAAYEQVTVRALSDAQLEDHERALLELQRVGFALSDQLAALNATRMELELPDDIARHVAA